MLDLSEDKITWHLYLLMIVYGDSVNLTSSDPCREIDAKFELCTGSPNGPSRIVL
jgi:hypothetical protein